MEKVRIEDVEGRPGPAAVSRPLTSALDASDVALNYYELAPGESFAYGYHRHETQEELFIVQEGTVTFETESGDLVVEAGEVVRFAPGEFQRGVNEGKERVVAFALGAPQDRGKTEIRRQCDDCGGRTRHTIERTDGGTLARCLDCDSVTGRFE